MVRNLAAAVAVVVALGSALALNWDQLSTYYAAFAARFLPASASAPALAEDDTDAFYYCARSVARQIPDPASVQTFPSAQNARVQVLEEGGYRISAWVDEAREGGETVRHTFTCEVHREQDGWTLARLEVSAGESLVNL